MVARYTLLILLLSFIETDLAGQSKVESALQTVDEQYPQEKLHLFLNKEAFVAGETIWFKAYIFAGSVQSNISKTLYIELLDENKQSILQSLTPLANAFGESNIILPADLPEGNYYLRAYTKWMLNFDEAFQYIYHVPIYNPASPKSLVPKPVDWSVAIHPESGTLLAGRENKIAVRLTANGRLPQSWEGIVTESGNTAKTIHRFSSLNEQIATLTLLPEAGKTYELLVTDNAGNKKVLNFRSSTRGVALKAKQEGNNLHVQIIFHATEGQSTYKLVAVSHGQLFYRAIVKNSNSVIEVPIPVDKLPTGIIQLTLFDAAENAAAERLVFLQTESQPSVQVTTPILSQTVRSLNEWQVEADTSLRSSYAISITDATLTPLRKRSIKSDLWLGDFVSDIHNPHWYFSGDTFQLEAIDALLLTEKWSRYNWKLLLSDSFPTIRHQPEHYLSFKGNAMQNEERLKEQKLSLLFRFKDSSLHFSQVTTDQYGDFFIQNAAFYDSVLVYSQPNATKNAVKDLQLLFERENRFSVFQGRLPHSSLILNEKDTSRSALPFIKNVLNNLENEKLLTGKSGTLTEVIVKTKAKTKKEQLEVKLSSALFSPGNQIVFDFINEEQNALVYDNIFDWLEGRVAGLSFTILQEPRMDPLTQSIIPAGLRIPVMRDEYPTIFVDEILSEMTLVHNLPVSQIAMVKVIKGYFLGAPSGGGGGGAIAIYTKKAGLADEKKKEKQPAGVLVGYTPLQAFSELNYGNSQSVKPKNDARQQLYWNANLFKPADISAKVMFYSNDLRNPLHLVITGFTKDAKPVYMEKLIKGSE